MPRATPKNHGITRTDPTCYFWLIRHNMRKATIKRCHRKENGTRQTICSHAHVYLLAKHWSDTCHIRSDRRKHIYTNVVRLPNFRCSDLIKIQSHFKYLNGTTAHPDRSRTKSTAQIVGAAIFTRPYGSV